MKSLINYVNEWKLGNDDDIRNGDKYIFYPKDKSELITIISRRIKSNIEEPYLLDIEVSKITNMNHLFSKYLLHYKDNDIDVSKIKRINISGWNTQSADDISFMFCGCKDLEYIDISKCVFNAKKCTYMFYECESLKEIKGIDLLKDCDKQDYMFYGCKKLKKPSWYTFNEA